MNSTRAWAGLLGEFANQSAAYTKRQQDLEDKKLEEANYNRRLDAQLAKEKAMAEYGFTQQDKRDAKAYEERAKERGEDKATRAEERAADIAWRREESAADRSERAADRAASRENQIAMLKMQAAIDSGKPGEIGRMAKDLKAMGMSDEEVKSLIVSSKEKEKYSQGDKVKAYNDAYNARIKALDDEGFDRKKMHSEASKYAASVSGFDPFNNQKQVVTPGSAGEGMNNPQKTSAMFSKLMEIYTARGPQVAEQELKTLEAKNPNMAIDLRRMFEEQLGKNAQTEKKRGILTDAQLNFQGTP